MAKITYYWITRNYTIYYRTPVKLWSSKPQKDSDGEWRGPNYITAFCKKQWSKMNPELRLRKGEIRKIKRTSLKHGFKWEICNG